MVNIKAYIGDEPYIFISYSHKDDEVESILKEIDSNDYRFWYDEGIISGRAWAAEISNRIKNCCQFVVFISKNSVESENVKDEVHLAVKYNLDIQVIYIDDVQLDGELELHLDRKQAVRKQKYSTPMAFYNKLISVLSKDAIENSGDCVTQATDNFKAEYTILSDIIDRNGKKTHLALKNNLNISTLAKHFCFKKSVYGSEIMRSAIDEASILKELQNKNCPFTPKMFDYFEDEENIFLVEEYIKGKTLDKVIASLDRSDIKALQEKCIDICIKICSILRYLHNMENPIVHRDIKPQNLLLTENNDVFLIDFDICLRYKQVAPYEFTSLGTRGYASPEQYSSQTVPDNRSDIYSLGMLLKHMLSGVSPLENVLTVLNYEKTPLRFYSKKFSPELERIITKMTMSDASQRYSCVEEVVIDLQNYKNVNKIGLLLKSNNEVKKHKKMLDKQKQNAQFAVPQRPPAIPVMPKAPQTPYQGFHIPGAPTPNSVPTAPRVPTPTTYPFVTAQNQKTNTPVFANAYGEETTLLETTVLG